jgi:hypothetical protein
VAAGGGTSTAPRTIGDLLGYLRQGPGRVPVLGVSMRPDSVTIEYADGCLVQELTYLTGTGS